ncbi:O-antigen ligase family protein [candidate division WS5 bacterium]|uniref:O-antigen ligase family protein n=1 Tax=candidate division WS5 bacterium TaxID=2093353 RepID=A0A419DCM6_9BACT|nr:MAG: O-antigen ligase family protein [candidate division WS5 bacterium]
MNSNIITKVSINKLPLFLIFLVPILTVIITHYTNDVAISLYILIVLCIVSAVLLIFIINPFWGFIFILVYKPFADLVTLPLVNSGGRIVFFILVISWFLKYVFHGKTKAFELLNSNKIIVFFVFSLFVSSFFAIKPLPSFAKSIEVTAYIIMSFFIMQDVVTDKKKLNILIIALALSLGGVSFFAINDFIITGSINKYGYMRRLGGIYSNPNQLGSALMYGIPFILYISLNTKNNALKILFIILFFTSFFSLGLTVSRTYLIGFVVFIISYLMLGVKHKTIDLKRFLIIIMIITVLSLLLYHFFIDNIIERASQDISEDLRYFIFLKGLRLLFIEHPFIGVGLENFQHTVVSDTNLNIILSQHGGMHGHDIVSKLFASIGLFGTVILLIIMYRIFNNFNRAAKIGFLQNDRYLFNLIILLQAGYIALLSSAIGTGLIFNSNFWTYYSLSVLLYKWGDKNVILLNNKP